MIESISCLYLFTHVHLNVNDPHYRIFPVNDISIPNKFLDYGINNIIATVENA